MTLHNFIRCSVLLIFVFHFFLGFSQEQPSIKNFSPTDYSGENQNWDISQSSDKLVYVANSRGLLEFNGAFWKLYTSVNESIIRSVKVVDDRIYTGCFMEFGYWKKNNVATLEYTSITQQLNISLLEDEEFWNILNVDDWIVFQSLKRIYLYNVKDETVSVINGEAKISKIYEINKEVYFQILGKGIFKINGGQGILFLDHDVLKTDEVINIFNKDEELLLITKNNGIYNFRDKKLAKSKTLNTDIVTSLSVYDAIMLKDKSIALGTIANGLVILGENGEIVSQLSLYNGLINNTVLSLFEDDNNTIWLGLDNGISFIDFNTSFAYYNESNGVLGSIYASALYKGNLYLGTNQGLYYKNFNTTDNFKFIEGSQGQVWCLKEINETLFCGHNEGTFLVEEDRVKRISNILGTWNISRIDNNENLLLQGNYEGLYVLQKTGTGWEVRNKLNGFNNSSRYFETLGNEIFVNHEYKGIFKLEVDSLYTEIRKVTIDSTLKGTDSGLAKYRGDLLYAYKEGIFKYDVINQHFKKDSLFSKAYNQDLYESGKLIVHEKDPALWVFTKSDISVITPTGLGSEQRIKNISQTSEVRKGIVGYENISSLGNNKYLIGTTNGYAIIDITEKEPKDFNISIDQVMNSGINSPKQLQQKDMAGSFLNNENNVDFSFYTPEFNKHITTLYQYQLLGMYNDWSDWSPKPLATFENLPHGDYIFNVRSRIGNSVSNNVATYKFEIAKPWFITNTFLLLYVLGLIGILIFTHTRYKKYYKKQQENLILKQEKELTLQQVQSEAEIIKLKNDKLQLDFSSKSKELAASLMSIAKKNDLLRTVKMDLWNIKKSDDSSLKSVINTINKSLKQDDDWEFFQEAFNNADSEFLKNLKLKHPKLTPSDLKLCGYLRLNLSSKEMSNLLNITPRSVEIKRYRLRKKLELEHEDNLVTYILGL